MSQASNNPTYRYRRILLINGPNLNLLGKREPHIYGSTTLDDIEQRLKATANAQGVELICLQSNHEGQLVDYIQHHGLLAAESLSHSDSNANTDANNDMVDAVIINPAAFTHTSVAIRDALLATEKPFIEVHLSNIHSREPFRTHSYFSDKAVGVICGLGHLGYDMALDYFLAQYKETK
ncbi:type II 3-dehydroquinate dehydratase [Psychrobacter sp. FDAARGOS_221]|uniref:type II 3-dehydroquinate dehydratase n=1 Tax=Psychrobacter sp. FDAARGOS_221 TaxID=1975705 RepID=UPI000BB52FC2|nr:type II 3-dehydroquinate dehydratase [Psychrobacter sp. FDAARGOS_221]PNK61540.1 3-dehydroquinate dehydratase [Psychrobacter sp. FDAARGOS_221]